MENPNTKAQQEAGPYTGDESNQKPVDARTLGHSMNKVVIENEKGTQVMDVDSVVKAPLTEKIRKPVEEVTTRVSTDENTVVEETVKTTVPTEEKHPDTEGTDKDRKSNPKKTTHPKHKYK